MAAIYLLPFVFVGMGLQFRRLNKAYGLTDGQLLASLFNLSGRYWQSRPIRVLLK